MSGVLFQRIFWHQCVICIIIEELFFTVCCDSLGDRISVSGPEGTFSLRPLRDVTVLYLLAAGTGFTPMARLIQLALQDIDTIRWELSEHSKAQEEKHLNGTSLLNMLILGSTWIFLCYEIVRFKVLEYLLLSQHW